MADVFISYARPNRAIASRLARDLERRGYQVWWDAELVGSDNFQDVILTALLRAKAVIVLWTPESIKSRFVIDEARLALHHNKLVTTRLPNVSAFDLPLGFQSQHAVEVDNRADIVKSLAKLGVGANAGQNRDPIDNALGSIGEAKQPEARAAAVENFRKARFAESEAVEVRKITGSNRLSAFFSGLIFRNPEFQLSDRAFWTAIGNSTAALLIVYEVIFDVLLTQNFATIIVETRISLMNVGVPYALASYLMVIPLSLLALMIVLLANRYKLFLRMNLKIPAYLIVPSLAATVAVFVDLGLAWFSVYNTPAILDYRGFIACIIIMIVILWAARQMRLAR